MALEVFNGSQAAKERWEAGVERELGDQSQSMLIKICEPKTDTTGNNKVWFRIMGASKAVRRNGKFSVVGKSKGGKIRTIALTLEEIIANDSFLDSEVKSTDISLDKELMKNQADSILVDENFMIIDKIEEGVLDRSIKEIDDSSGQTGFYESVVKAMTSLIGFTSKVHIVVDRFGWGTILQDDKLINRDFHDAYLAKNGNIDGLPIAGGRVLFLRNIEKEVYGVDSFIEKGVAYFIGDRSIGCGFAKGINSKSGWDSQEMAYYLQSIAYFNAIVKFPKKIVKLKYKVPDNIDALMAAGYSAYEAVPRTGEPKDPFDSRAEQLDGMSDRELKQLLKINTLDFKEGESYSKEGAIDLILAKEFPEEYEE